MTAELQAAEFPLAHAEDQEPDAATLARLAGEERAVETTRLFERLEDDAL